MKRYRDFSIGDIISLTNTKLVGVIVGEQRHNEIFRVEWLNNKDTVDASWVSYHRLEKPT